MILATYRPKPSDPPKNTETEMLKAFHNWLGYTPIWCIPANTLQELFKYSFLYTNLYPEEIIVFETDTFKPIDDVLWNKAYYTYLQTHTFDETLFERCFDIQDPKYCQYLVERVPEDRVLFHYNIHEMLYETTYYYGNGDWPYANAQLNKVVFNARALVYMVTAGSTRYGARERSAIEKTAFDVFLAPLLIGAELPGQTEEDVMRYNVSKAMYEFPNWANLIAENTGSMGRPCYEALDRAFSLIDACFLPIAPWPKRKIGPNEPCPCGSGKKYKKCCKGRYRS